jgi:adenylosuccinate synthase
MSNGATGGGTRAAARIRDGHVIVVGLGFGDEGKGATVDWLCAADPDRVAAVVRFNGGAQAAHNVVAGGTWHTFSQFGSGSLHGVRTFLSRHMLVEPIALAGEAEELAALGVAHPLRLLRVDGRALLTTPVHVAANRAREDARGARRHGSCGKGIGETVDYALRHRSDAPTVADCAEPRRLTAKLDALARHHAPLLRAAGRDHPSVAAMVEVYREFAASVRVVDAGWLGRHAAGGRRLVFEGAQGVLLDEWRGFHPHTTWSTVEPRNARALLAEIGQTGSVLGVARAYATRHGAGPLPTEDAGLAALLPEAHNATDAYQGSWRVGHLDLPLARYAAAGCGGLDGVVVTHLDAVRGAAEAVRVATAYELDDGERLATLPLGRWRDREHQRRLTALLGRGRPVLREARPDQLPAAIAAAVGAPLVALATGPDRAHRFWTERSVEPAPPGLPVLPASRRVDRGSAGRPQPAVVDSGGSSHAQTTAGRPVC